MNNDPTPPKDPSTTLLQPGYWRLLVPFQDKFERGDERYGMHSINRITMQWGPICSQDVGLGVMDFHDPIRRRVALPVAHREKDEDESGTSESEALQSALDNLFSSQQREIALEKELQALRAENPTPYGLNQVRDFLWDLYQEVLHCGFGDPWDAEDGGRDCPQEFMCELEKFDAMHAENIKQVNHCLDLIRAMATSMPKLPMKSDGFQYGWVIENGKDFAELRYRTMNQGIIDWTADNSKALRFARREDAEMFAAEDEDAWKISEHAWDMQAAPSPSAAPTGMGLGGAYPAQYDASDELAAAKAKTMPTGMGFIQAIEKSGYAYDPIKAEPFQKGWNAALASRALPMPVQIFLDEVEDYFSDRVDGAPDASSNEKLAMGFLNDIKRIKGEVL